MSTFRSIAAIGRAIAAVRSMFVPAAHASQYMPLSARATKPQSMDRKNKSKRPAAGTQASTYLKPDAQKGQSRAYLR